MDSTLLLFIVMFALVALVAVVLVSIQRKRAQAGSSVNDTGTTAAEESSSGRPLYKDPDPERMAGGRARFTPPGD